jgi:hypothetical protein
MSGHFPSFLVYENFQALALFPYIFLALVVEFTLLLLSIEYISVTPFVSIP